MRASDSLTASRSSPSRGTCRRRCSSIHARFSRSTCSTSTRLIERGTVSRAGSPHGTSSRHRRARGDRRTTTSSTRETVAVASADGDDPPRPVECSQFEGGGPKQSQKPSGLTSRPMSLLRRGHENRRLSGKRLSFPERTR